MTKKIGISLPDRLYEWVQRQVDEGQVESVSGAIAEALEAKRRNDELAVLVNDLKREHGEPSAEAYAWADKVIAAALAARSGTSTAA